jgi:hypothetical protein
MMHYARYGHRHILITRSIMHARHEERFTSGIGQRRFEVYACHLCSPFLIGWAEWDYYQSRATCSACSVFMPLVKNFGGS